ncbi:hypothetical protein RIVM261_019270 [Rivularia sp. IAM M-261]|nr:hypothetical protein CAL7716_027980 [Calothrix sp. PCC 7716]GJD16971.1 hypothetical protein RIVM261_019270 [Rivularia sp. IAM M-261]
MPIYEETPDIQKQAVVREEVKVTKFVEQDTVYLISYNSK